MTPMSGKDQETDLSRKRKRIDTDNLLPSKKIRGKDNMSNSTDSFDDQERVNTRKRCKSPPNPPNGKESAEDFRVHTSKRKASDEDDAPEKKKRCSHWTSSSESTSSGSMITVSSAAVSSNSESGIPYAVLSSSSTDIRRNGKKKKAGGGFDTGLDLGTVSAVEEEIYKRSSSGNMSRIDLEVKYKELDHLGSGGFGTVFSGLRRSDNLPVAIKHIPARDVKVERVICNGKVYNIILEVAFMLKTAGLTGIVGQSTAVSLLDWYTLEDELILVMEKPSPCMDLKQYVKANNGGLDEQEAKMIFKQLVDAAIDLLAKGVFHRDIKLQNVLVQFDSSEPRVRLIDFGCGSFYEKKCYQSFSGTFIYAPPEWFDYGIYWAHSTTVWQLGALFYSLLSDHDKFTTESYVDNMIQINSNLSEDVKTLLLMCLNCDPMERATLEELQQHPALR